MKAAGEFYVRFWGVRGSIACPGPRTTRYGGNTACVEISCGGRLLLFDAGTGLHEFGERMCKGGPLDADLFLSHTHFDHICGFPFFSPAFARDCRLRIWAGHLLPDRNLRDVLFNFMLDPYFPVPMDTMHAQLTFLDFRAGEVIEPGDGIVIRTAPLQHPNGATGYRVEYDGRAVCYVTDTEHDEDGLDANIRGLIEGADVFIYDSTYTDAEFPDHRQWGHSTWQQGVRLADAAGVKRYVAFHHDPDHDDEAMDAIAAELAEARPGSVVAQEGLTLKP